MGRFMKQGINFPLLLLLMLPRGLQSSYEDKHFIIKCKNVLPIGYVYQISLRNVTHINMASGVEIQNRYSTGQQWVARDCEADHRNNKTMNCVLSTKEYSIARFGELRLVNITTNEVLLKTDGTFYRYRENYKCYNEHGFKMFNVLSENIDSIAFSYELYVHDIEQFINQRNPLKVRYHPINKQKNITYYHTDGIMKGSNHEIIANLKPCTQYMICAQIMLRPVIMLYEKTRCLQATTYCQKTFYIEVKVREYTLVYGMGGLFVVCFVLLVFFMKRRYSKQAQCPRAHVIIEHDEAPLSRPPPLPKRPKHLQPRTERILRVLKIKNTNLSMAKGEHVRRDGARVIDRELTRLSLSNKDHAIKHLYSSIQDMTSFEIAALRERRFSQEEEETFLPVDMMNELNIHNNGVSGTSYDSESYLQSSTSDVCTSSSSSGDYNIY